MKKKKIAILFGGRSGEHEVSLRSARTIFEGLNKDNYDILAFFIDKTGFWYSVDNVCFLSDTIIPEEDKRISITPHGGNMAFCFFGNGIVIDSIDAVFPVLHGPLGEDGTVQGLLRMADIPFVGCDVLSSAICMDKEISKRLLRDAGIRITDFFVMTDDDKLLSFEEASELFGTPLFVKPANMGSSVGVSCVMNAIDYDNALRNAFLYDTKIIIERVVVGVEIECAVLGTINPIASLVGKIIPNEDVFYSYDAKYINDTGAMVECPAEFGDELLSKIQSVALFAYRTLQCSGLARVDMFLKEDGEVILNEVNTLPGFTSISMYPKLWEASGKPLTKLLDELVEDAFFRYERKCNLKTSYK